MISKGENDMRKLFFVVSMEILLVYLPVMAQAQTMSDEAVATAVERGNKTTPDRVGLVLTPSGFGLKDFVGGGISLNPLNSNANPWDGFAVVLFTPQTWVEQAAAKAKAVYKPFSINDVTDDMRRPVLRIFSKQGYVERIVIRSADKASAIQLSASITCPDDAIYFGNNGGSLECRGFEFSMDEVRKIQSLDKNKELLVTVILIQAAGERDFKVQKKHLKRLPTL